MNEHHTKTTHHSIPTPVQEAIDAIKHARTHGEIKKTCKIYVKKFAICPEAIGYLPVQAQKILLTIRDPNHRMKEQHVTTPWEMAHLKVY
jgi:hypothetical protein